MADEICPDYHVCRNGANCVESTYREGSFFCDCDKQDEVEHAHAGISCEHEATIYCNALNKKSYTSFCTNGGICKENVAVSAPHQGCECQTPYTGDFCEFIVGQNIPEGMDPTTNAVDSPVTTSANAESSVPAIALSFLVIAVVLASVVTYYLLKHGMRRRRTAADEVPAPSTPVKPERKSSSLDMNIEADGAVLQEAVIKMRKIPSPPTTPSTVIGDEEMDVPESPDGDKVFHSHNDDSFTSQQEDNDDEEEKENKTKEII